MAEIERQVEAGKLSLADLNALAEQGIDISIGVVKPIFGTANPEVTWRFCTATSTMKRSAKESQKELRRLLASQLR